VQLCLELRVGRLDECLEMVLDRGLDRELDSVQDLFLLAFHLLDCGSVLVQLAGQALDFVVLAGNQLFEGFNRFLLGFKLLSWNCLIQQLFLLVRNLLQLSHLLEQLYDSLLLLGVLLV